MKKGAASPSNGDAEREVHSPRNFIRSVEGKSEINTGRRRSGWPLTCTCICVELTNLPCRREPLSSLFYKKSVTLFTLQHRYTFQNVCIFRIACSPCLFVWTWIHHSRRWSRRHEKKTCSC